MEDIKLSLDRENILEFNVDIQGYANTTVNKKPQVRMVLEQNNIGFCMSAKKDNNNYSVTIPEMKNILESGVCDARMEVIIDNKYFVPWESKIEFDKEVKVEAAPVVRNDPQVSMTVKAQPVIREEKVESKPKETVVKENSQIKTKKKTGIKLIVDNKPKKKLRKESKSVNTIINDLNILANQFE